MKYPSVSTVEVTAVGVAVEAVRGDESRSVSLNFADASALIWSDDDVAMVPDPSRSALAALSGASSVWDEWVTVLVRAPGLAGEVTERTPYLMAAALRSVSSLMSPLTFDWVLPLARVVSTAVVSGSQEELDPLIELAVASAVAGGPGAARAAATLTEPFGALQCMSGTLACFEMVSTSRYEQFSEAIEVVESSGASEPVLSGLHRVEGVIRDRAVRSVGFHF